MTLDLHAETQYNNPIFSRDITDLLFHSTIGLTLLTQVCLTTLSKNCMIKM